MNTEQPVGSQYDPELVNRLKKEIMTDLKTRREWQERYYGDMPEYAEEYSGNRPGPGYGMGYGRPGAGYRRGFGRRGYGPGMGVGPGSYYGWCPYPNQPSPQAAPASPMYKNKKQPEYDYDWWLEREEYDYQRNMMLLRRQLQNELQAVDRINQRLGQVKDPQVRQLVYDLLQEASQQNVPVSELLQSINMNNQAQGIGGSVLDRITGPIKGIDRRSLGWGAGVALLGILLMPSLAKTLRPFARKAMEEVMEISDRAQSMFAHAKEEFEDIVAEASFNRIKDSVSAQSGIATDAEPTK